MTLLHRLQQWYQRQCNGEWEHRRGVAIQSCDNPGWRVQIDLTGTSLADLPFDSVAENVNDQGFPLSNRWLCCRRVDDVWEGAGDETRLEEILSVFLTWADSREPVGD